LLSEALGVASTWGFFISGRCLLALLITFHRLPKPEDHLCRAAAVVFLRFFTKDAQQILWKPHVYLRVFPTHYALRIALCFVMIKALCFIAVYSSVLHNLRHEQNRCASQFQDASRAEGQA
jgi:hypothetical protein